MHHEQVQSMLHTILQGAPRYTVRWRTRLACIKSPSPNTPARRECENYRTMHVRCGSLNPTSPRPSLQAYSGCSHHGHQCQQMFTLTLRCRTTALASSGRLSKATGRLAPLLTPPQTRPSTLQTVRCFRQSMKSIPSGTAPTRYGAEPTSGEGLRAQERCNQTTHLQAAVP